MQLVYDFGVNLSEYHRLGRKNSFPELEECPICMNRCKILSHGYYERNAVTHRKEFRIIIKRYKCANCIATISILPSFLISRFQSTLRYLLRCLGERFKGNWAFSYYQKLQHYRKRFTKNAGAVELFFRIMGVRETIPQEVQEKAMKLLALIKKVGKESFARDFHHQHNKSFMATTI